MKRISDNWVHWLVAWIIKQQQHQPIHLSVGRSVKRNFNASARIAQGLWFVSFTLLFFLFLLPMLLLFCGWIGCWSLVCTLSTEQTYGVVIAVVWLYHLLLPTTPCRLLRLQVCNACGSVCCGVNCVGLYGLMRLNVVLVCYFLVDNYSLLLLWLFYLPFESQLCCCRWQVLHCWGISGQEDNVVDSTFVFDWFLLLLLLLFAVFVVLVCLSLLVVVTASAKQQQSAAISLRSADKYEPPATGASVCMCYTTVVSFKF